MALFQTGWVPLPALPIAEERHRAATAGFPAAISGARSVPGV